jgi:nitrite reductase/ring-hydroxylating ferredoxin subunit
MKETIWVELPLPAIEDGGVRTVKVEGHQLAVFRRGEQLHAIDNRCPHEGYPLASGSLSGNLLTCEWHNWKFELDSGRCLLGGEDVRAYTLRRDGDRWLVDLAEPPGAIEGLLATLESAFDEADWGRAARTIERLLARGLEAPAVLARVCRFAAARAPYGFDHGLAAAADLAALLDGSSRDGELLLEACVLMTEPNLRRSPLPVAVPIAGLGEGELRAAIEAEAVSRAEAIVRGAVAGGIPPAEILAWLSRAAGDHFYDYGHAEIFVVKGGELIERLGDDPAAAEILVALARMIAYGTREDRLPYMRAYQRLAAPHLSRLDALAAAGERDGDLEVDGFLAAILEGDLAAALGAVGVALESGVAPDRVALALGLAASHRLARFDPALERDPSIGHGWLDATHLVTYADAVRETLRRRPSPEARRGLFFAARFVQHTGALDGERTGCSDGPSEPPGEADLWRIAFAGGATPIFFAHRVKTTAAALRLHRAMDADRQLAGRRDRATPLLASLRYLEAPIDERRNRRRAVAARRFVVDGSRLESRLGY